MSRIKYLLLSVCLSCSPSFAFNINLPAYANPCCGNGPEVWSRLLQTATTNMDLAASAGCDALEPDNVDGLQNDETQGGITAYDQLALKRWLADEAHARGLGVGLKNDLSQIPAPLDAFDFAVNEQCFAFGNECTVYETTCLAARLPGATDYAELRR